MLVPTLTMSTNAPFASTIFLGRVLARCVGRPRITVFSVSSLHMMLVAVDAHFPFASPDQNLDV